MLERIQHNLYKNFLLIISTAIVYLASLVKFAYCRNQDFSGFAAVYRGCYSDIPEFWFRRRLDLHIWPIQPTNLPQININIGPIEYPVLIGLFIWLISYLVPLGANSAIYFFDINTALLGILFFVAVLIMNKLNNKRVYFYIFAPPVLLSLFINWDMLAVTPMLAAILFFDRKRYNLSAALLAVAIAAKFFPVVLILPIAIIFIKNKQLKLGLDFIAKVFISWSLINLPFMLISWTGWISFFENSVNRGISFGSLWEVFQIFGVTISNINLVYIGSTITIFAFVTWYLVKTKTELNLAIAAFFPVMAFTIFNKVYSPQYILWLVPLAALAIRTSTQKFVYSFWIFQETIYQIAIWKYIYWLGWGGHVLGFSPKLYALLSLFRIVILFIFSLALMQNSSKKIIEIT